MVSERQARILIVDDAESLRRDISTALQEMDQPVSILEGANGLDGFKTLLRERPDLVICDLVMPQMDGFKFLQMRGSRPELGSIPVLMLTAVEKIEEKIRVLAAGASDYITKPFHPKELQARVMAHLKTKLLQDELRAKNALLQELSTTDGLTRIYNRRHLLELGQAEFERSDRQGAHLSLMLFDLDHFKRINDEFGHQEGDRVLKAVCKAALGELRSYDIFGRYGGDEFMAIFPQTNAGQALKVGKRIRLRVNKDVLDPEGLPVDISGGVATRFLKEETLDDLIRIADETLYDVKNAGRGGVRHREEK